MKFLLVVPLFPILLACNGPASGESSAPPSGDSPAPDSGESSSQPQGQPGNSDAYKPLREPKEGEEVAVLETNQGNIVLRFFPDKAPKHVENFLKLAKSGFYDGTKFHRVIPGFMIQGGDPNSKDADRSNDGGGGPDYTIDAEFNDVPHVRGILSMARTPDPNSAGSQFFIMVADKNPEGGPWSQLDGQYSVFGAVVSGIEAVDKIVNLPRDERDNPLAGNPALVKKVRVAKWPVK